MSEDIIQVENVSFYRGERPIYSGINLTIPKGKITAILGPSGTGKTTLLRLMGALLRPDKGKISVLGQNPHAISRKSLFALRREIGMLFQYSALFTDLSTFENVAFPIREHIDLPESMICDTIMMKLQAVGLRGAYNLMPSELSGGMARRVALARAIALDPQIMFYDEPFTGQDPIAMAVVLRLVKQLNDALNMTSVVVTHDVAEVFSIADYAYILSGGAIIAQGTPYELSNTDSSEVKQFIEGHSDGPVPFHFPAPTMAQSLRINNKGKL